MIGRWSTWKRFPDAFHGEHIEAPIGPGVYEVCHNASGEQVAFGYAGNVAQALSNILPRRPRADGRSSAAPRGSDIRSASWNTAPAPQARPPRRGSPPSN